MGNTPHSFGLPIFSNSISLKGLVKLAVKVKGKLKFFLTFKDLKNPFVQKIIFLLKII